jgi:hypothetical protein
MSPWSMRVPAQASTSSITNSLSRATHGQFQPATTVAKHSASVDDSVHGTAAVTGQWSAGMSRIQIASWVDYDSDKARQGRDTNKTLDPRQHENEEG